MSLINQIQETGFLVAIFARKTEIWLKNPVSVCLAIACILSTILGCASKANISPPFEAGAKGYSPNPKSTNDSADYSRTPVLFVHGSGLSSSTWQPTIEHLQEIGYPSAYLYAVELKPNDGANDRAAETFIAPAVESLLTKAQEAARNAAKEKSHAELMPVKVDIVAHSMGAASSRWYIAKLHPERVRTWISLAGANHGTNALCGHSGAGNQQMCPAFAASAEDSLLQVALNGTPSAPIDETPYGLGVDSPQVKTIPPDADRAILYLSVRIEPDGWIKPENSAVIDGAGGLPIPVPGGVPVQETSPGNYLFQGRVGHDPLPQHPDLIRLVASMLSVRDGQERR
jgi:pimeloyl-ACP methyl ester carboxylesterase